MFMGLPEIWPISLANSPGVFGLPKPDGGGVSDGIG